VSVRLAGTPPEPARVAAALPELVRALPAPLEPLAQGVLGLERELDLVARAGDGAAVVVLVAGAGEDLAALGDLAAQRAWLAPRLRDWQRLAPGLGLAPERGARGLLVAPGFDARTVAAAGALPGTSLARVLSLEWEGRTAFVLEPLPGPAEAPRLPPPERAPEGEAAPTGFRSGLRDEDLGLPRRPTRLAPRG
jgi:hypothetical protein